MAKKPDLRARRILMTADAVAQPTPDQARVREQNRHERALIGGPMRRVIDAVIASGVPVEVETDTHVVTITATLK